MDWNDVRHFLALAREGSIRGAGASLGVSHSTVARRVEALEERLCVRLFDRNRDGYSLTDAGRQMLPGAERVEREMAALERGLVGQDERLSGPVALTCCDNYVADVVLRELTGFCAAYPEIELCFTTDTRPFSLSKREADLAIRTLPRGGQPPEHLLGRAVAPVVIANYVAIEHAPRVDPGQGHPTRWVSFEDRKTQELMIAGTSYPDLPAWGGFSTLELMVQATLRGLGIAILPTYVGDREPGLRRLSEPDLRHVADLWVLCHPDLRENARIQATRNEVVAALERNRALFDGGRRDDAPLGSENAPRAASGGDLD